MKDYLTFGTFMTNANIPQIIENIKKSTLQLYKDKQKDPLLIITINNIVQMLDNIQLMLDNSSVISQQKQRTAIEKLILVHQSLINYRQDNNITEGAVITIMNELTVFYPLFLIGEIINNEE